MWLGRLVCAFDRTRVPRSLEQLPDGEAGRSILFERDGSANTMALRLSTIITYKLDVTILVINNCFEQLIDGMDDGCNDIAPW